MTIKQIINSLRELKGFTLKVNDDNVIEILPDDPLGFPVFLTSTDKELLIQWGPCHQHFDDKYSSREEGLKLFYYSLSTKARLKVFSRGSYDYNWRFEINNGPAWDLIDSTYIGSMFWKKKKERTYQNNILDNKTLGKILSQYGQCI